MRLAEGRGREARAVGEGGSSQLSAAFMRHVLVQRCLQSAALPGHAATLASFKPPPLRLLELLKLSLTLHYLRQSAGHLPWTFRMFLGMFYWMVLAYPLTVLLTFLGTVVLTIIVYLKSLFRAKDCMPRPIYRDSELARHLLASCPNLRRPFRPPLLAQSAHMQSFLGLGWGLERGAADFDREYVELEDGGVAALDWEMSSRFLPDTRPLLLLLPGLTGDASTMAAFTAAAAEKGHRVVVVNRRGHANSCLTTPRLQSYSDPRDLRQVVRYLRSAYPRAYLTAVGAGAGADLLLSYLGQYGSSCHLAAAACVSPTYDSQALVRSGLPAPFERLYVHHQRRLLQRHAAAFSTVLDVQAVSRLASMQDLCQQVHCPLYGYQDTEEMWDNDNPLREMDEIAVPVLCLNSVDDPLCPKDAIPLDLFRSCPNFFLVMLERGGHAGFREGLQGPSWAELASLDFVENTIRFLAEKSEMEARLLRPRSYSSLL